MNHTQLHFLWSDRSLGRRFRTAVSLHSHTSYSEESLEFIPRYTEKVPWLGDGVRRQQELHRRRMGETIDFNRGFWTPPLTPGEALALEQRQLEREFDAHPLVSLTDHDNLRAPNSLHLMGQTSVPLSFEWTIPFGPTFFHLGVHNLPVRRAAAIFADLAAFTADPRPERLGPLLDLLHAIPDVLTVLNHPFWDEKGIGAGEHAHVLGRLLERHGDRIHALELNGLRGWRENKRVCWLGRQTGHPVISGGDRHGLEPNTIVNVTNAATFSEFVAEIRDDRASDVVFLPAYREPLRLRVLQTMWDIVRPYPEFPAGRREWADRVFYRLTDTNVQPLSALWPGGGPRIVKQFLALMHLLDIRQVRAALRFALEERQEFSL